MGATYSTCIYQPDEVNTYRDPETSRLVVNIEDHVPIVLPEIYIPSMASLANLTGCTDTEKEKLASRIIDHEAIHALIDLEWADGKYENAVVDGVSYRYPWDYGATIPSELEKGRRASYVAWCKNNVIPRIYPYHEESHKFVGKGIDYTGISCQCALGQETRDPQSPEVNCESAAQGEQSLWCKCNDTFYDTLQACMLGCKVTLNCYQNNCIPVPRSR
jgi:hypothetical protein